MVQQLSIVTYGNGDILREIFNAVAAGMGDSTFQTLIHLTLLLAGTWAVAKLIFKRDIMVGVGWIALYAAFGHQSLVAGMVRAHPQGCGAVSVVCAF